MSLWERWSGHLWLLFTLPLCPTDEKVQISIVLDDQLVIIAAYSVTNKSSFIVTWTHPQAQGKCRQTAHVWHFHNIMDSFVRKVERVV